MALRLEASKVITLYRTDTTLDLSQKAEKGMTSSATGPAPLGGGTGRGRRAMVGWVLGQIVVRGRSNHYMIDVVHIRVPPAMVYVLIFLC